MVPVKLVYLSYGVASTYVITHSTFCARKKLPHQHHGSTNSTALSPANAFLDTLIWQGLASVIVPGLFINRTCALSRILLYRLTRRQLNKTARKWVATGIGLGSIPFIVQPIDR